MTTDQKAKAWDTLKKGLYDMSQGTRFLGLGVKDQTSRNAKELFDLLVAVEMNIQAKESPRE